MNDQTPTPGSRNMRWWMPAGIAALGLGSVAWLRIREAAFIEQLSLGITLLTGLLLGAWYVLFTGLRWQRRLLLGGIGLLLIAILVFVISRYTRVEGSVSGSGIPRLVWKWSPTKDARLEALAPALESAPSREDPGSVANLRYEGFLGPDRSAVLMGVPLDRDWLTHPAAQVWRQPIGLGWSSFAVTGTRAITQEQRAETELVVCYDLLSGKPLWSHTNHARFSESLGGDGPRATPTIHGDRLYTMGATGILDCLDLDSGRPIWTRDVLAENDLGNITWGKSCSPLIVSKLVVVTGGDRPEKSLLAYDAKDGTPAWQAGRDRASYCSPTLRTLAGVTQILIVNAESISGHAPSDGRRLWEHPWPGKYPKVTQPLVVDTNRVFISAGYGVGCALLQIEPTANGAAWKVSEVWKNRNLKPKFANVIRRGNFVYGLDEGTLACVSLEDGSRVWKDGRYGHGQILLVDDVFLVQAESGEVALVDAVPTGHHEWARFEAIKGKTWNHPVLAGDYLLVRNDQEAACYRIPLSSSPRP